MVGRASGGRRDRPGTGSRGRPAGAGRGLLRGAGSHAGAHGQHCVWGQRSQSDGDGDAGARARLVEQGYTTLAASGGDLLETISAYLEGFGSIEGAARALFVHPNTVRYRLRRVSEITGFVPTEPRGAFALRVALTCGRLDTVGGNLQL